MNRWQTLSHPLTRIVALTALGLAAAAAYAAATVTPGQAQSPSCANTTLSANVEPGGMTAFIDAGVGNTITFVCIESAEFGGGEGGPFTADGTVANGCFVIDGIGTDIVAVFWEDPAVVPGCEQVESISVGLQQAPPTATPTTPGGGLTPTATSTAVVPTATGTATSVPATATATRTATTMPTSVATATRTTTTTNPTSVATATSTMVQPTMQPTTPPSTTAPATSTPARPTVLPPNTGGGTSGGDGGNMPILAGAVFMLITAGAGALVVSRKSERNRS